MNGSVTNVAEGTLVGLVAGKAGGPEVGEVRWRGDGFGLRASGQAFHRASLFANKPRAQLELFLPAGEWRLAFTRHSWSGEILVRDAASHRLFDLFAPGPRIEEIEVSVRSTGPDAPIAVEVAGQRHPESHASECWFNEARKAPSKFHPEAGTPVSQTCRLITARHVTFLALRTDSGVAEELATTGVWEQQQIDLFKRLTRPGETALDIGANLGHHTVALAKMLGENGLVVAFEPQMQMFNLLNANLVLNRCRNVLPFKLAVGSHADKMRMSAISYDDFMPFGSLGLQRDTSFVGRGERVDVVRLDDFLPSLDLGPSPVSLMKVDVQAHELPVFQGARAFLQQAQPSISFEVSPFWMRRAGYDWREILTLLEGLGYAFYDEAAKPLTIPEWDGQSQAEWQILAVHPRYQDRL
jgi:FkbM family methyltransferase